MRKGLWHHYRVVPRGESTIAVFGLLLAAVMLCAIGAAAWWSGRSQTHAIEKSRVREIESVGQLLSELAVSFLVIDELSAARRVFADAARAHDLASCRVVLPDGRVPVAADAAQVDLLTLPASWSSAPVSTTASSADDANLNLNLPLEIPGRGTAVIEIVAAPADPEPVLWRLRSGIGIIGAAAMVLVLLGYRRARQRFRALWFIRESLLSIERGEEDAEALTVPESLGAEAVGWNELVAEREQLREVLVSKRLLEVPTAQRERGIELTRMCDAMSQGLMLVDEDFNAVYANESAALYLGIARGQLLGAGVEGVLDSELVEALRSVISGSVRRSVTTEVTRTGDDAQGVLRLSVRPLRHEDAAAAMITIDDITQQRVADESRNTFVANVTHELRAPLTNILLYAHSAMEEDPPELQTMRTSMNVVTQEAERLQRVVNDMLSVAEIEAGTHKLRRDDVDLAAILGDLRDDYGALAQEKNISFELELPPKLPVLHADRDKIALALHNVVGNALKYTRENGSVVVNVDTSADVVSIRVMDTGIGIAPEELDNIFEKFYRAKDKQVADVTGSGLGLTLAREVTRLHGGDIAVESEVGKGSTFVLTLPIERPAAAA